MKIAQVMVAKGFGGAERYFVDLTLALAEQGHEVLAIIHPRFAGRELLASNNNINLQAIPFLGWWDLFHLAKMQTAILNFTPQVIHAHLARAAYLSGKVARKLHIPLMVKTHNYVDLSYYRDVDLFTATTEDQKRYLLQHGVAPDKVEVVPNFSSVSPVDSVVNKKQITQPVFVSMGRMVKKKGFDILLRAFNQLCEQGCQARLVIGGDGQEREQLVQLASELNCSDKISFCGWVDDICLFFEQADVFVLPSLDEPFGIVLLEAMALGKPVISTRTQGPLEILTDEVAVLIEPGNADALTQAMSDFIKDPQSAQQRAGYALNLFKQKYSKEVVVPRLIELYQGLI